MSDAIRFEVDGPVAVITIDRPEVRNAIDLPTARALEEVLDELDARTDLRAGVLTGAGSVFCAGMDLKAFATTGERPFTDVRGGFGIVQQPPVTPIIAAVEGKALGGGFEIALACDLVVASSESEFGLPEVRRGLVAAAGGVLRLPRRIPPAIAMELILTGAPISAARAADVGLVNRVVPPGDVLATALELARAIAANAPMAVRAAKAIAQRCGDWALADAFREQAVFTDPVRGSADAAEGARAFVEKRAPVWTDS